MIEVLRVEPEKWVSHFSEAAHKAVFNEIKPASLDRIDFALLALKNDKAIGYMTCREFDSESVYWQYGGVVDEHKKSIDTVRVYEAFYEWHKKHYKRCSTYIENWNIAMLKMAFKIGYRVIGVRNFKNSILLECLLEF